MAYSTEDMVEFVLRSVHCAISLVLFILYTTKLFQRRFYLLLEHQWLINQLFWTLSLVFMLATLLHYIPQIIMLITGPKLQASSYISLGMVVASTILRELISAIIPMLTSFWIFLYINLRFLHRILDIQHPLLFMKKIQVAIVIGVSIFCMWIQKKLAADCQNTGDRQCEFHMMFRSNLTCDHTFLASKNTNTSLKLNVLFELFNTGSIPLVFLFSLGFRFIIQKSEQLEDLDKSKLIFGVFQHLPIFVYGLIRFFLAPIYLIYTPGSFPPFDVFAFGVYCNNSEIFQFLIPLQFLFTNTKLAAKLWKKPFLNDTANQVYIEQQNDESEEGKGQIGVGDGKDEQVSRLSINSNNENPVTEKY
ncbi:unnamed protein product [Caenorhabditis angaria]|uniref:Uncharacterized protein n=1 Tax=Caenorhabditis angaria TaxID=860376 RepID=A0A9P1IKC6_9PELO|nr:unnamed protein product [Caenorhabditis angaria]